MHTTNAGLCGLAKNCDALETESRRNIFADGFFTVDEHKDEGNTDADFPGGCSQRGTFNLLPDHLENVGLSEVRHHENNINPRDKAMQEKFMPFFCLRADFPKSASLDTRTWGESAADTGLADEF